MKNQAKIKNLLNKITSLMARPAAWPATAVDFLQFLNPQAPADIEYIERPL